MWRRPWRRRGKTAATRSIVGNRFDCGGQVIHRLPVAGFGSRLRSAVNNLEDGIKVETFKINHPPKENDLKKLLLDAGVKIPPTVVFYEDGGILLARGSAEQLGLIERVVLKLNGYSPQEGHTNLLGKAIVVKHTNHLAKITVTNRVVNPAGTNLEMRVFKVDPNTFASGLRGVQGLQTNDVATQAEVATMALSLFGKLGVNLNGTQAPGRAIAFNDKLGLLFVRATPSELDTVERIVQALNQVPP
jgi:hypothetical protein